MTPTPRVISLDIETSGAFEYDSAGNPLPEQEDFHPRRLRFRAGIPLHELIGTISITIPKGDPHPRPWSLESVAALSPHQTMVLEYRNPDHRRILRRWLAWADTLIGMNLPYDLLFLRAIPEFRRFLRNHFILDVSVFRFLFCEAMPQRSLKDVGPVLRLYDYDRTLKEGRFRDASDPEGHLYVAQDSWNAMLAVAEFARRIEIEPDLSYFSNLAWLAVRMSEAGLPFSRSALQRLQWNSLVNAGYATRFCEDRGLYLDNSKGKGSHLCRTAYMNELVAHVDAVAPVQQTLGVQSVTDHPLLKLTDEKHDISFSEGNRMLMALLLPEDDPHQQVLKHWSLATENQGIVSKYTMPLLQRKRTAKAKRPYSDVLLPPPKGGFQCSLIPSPCESSSETAPMSPSPTAECASTSATSSDPLKNGSFSSTASSAQPSCKSAVGSPPKSSASAKSATADSSTPSTVRVEYNPDTWLAYPSWFIVPSSIKDTAEDEGGQRQGRIGCQHPNGQQHPQIIKDTYHSRYVGGSLISLDIKQAELRVAAVLSGDAGLLDAFANGLDLHTQRALEVFGPRLQDHYTAAQLDAWLHDQGKDDPAYKSFSKGYRQPCKHGNFTDLNLGGADVLQRTILIKSGLLVSLDLCYNIVNSRPTARPGLFAWQNAIIAEANRSERLVAPITGHTRTFIGGAAKNGPNEIVNYLIQTIAAVATLHIALAALPPDLDHPPYHLFTITYDAIYFDVSAPWKSHLRDTIIPRAVASVTADTGYWGLVQKHYGNKVALEYDISEH